MKKIFEECIFCMISKGKIPTKKIYENSNFFSVPDVNPKLRGHSLVISKQHFDNILEIPSTLGKDLLDCLNKTAEKLMKENNADGFNIFNNNFESAGQLIKHIHFHILPRKKGDGFSLNI